MSLQNHWTFEWFFIWIGKWIVLHIGTNNRKVISVRLPGAGAGAGAGGKYFGAGAGWYTGAGAGWYTGAGAGASECTPKKNNIHCVICFAQNVFIVLTYLPANGTLGAS